MRYADLLGDPDDDGNAPGTSTTEGPGVPASDSRTAPAGASGSLGGTPTDGADATPTEDDLARWFTADETEPAAVTDVAVTNELEPAPPTDAPTRAQALATATGALDEPASEESASEPAPAAPTPSGTARDDLLPARPSGHGRKRR